MYGYGYQYSAIISGGGNPAAAIFAAYKTRVLTDSGVCIMYGYGYQYGTTLLGGSLSTAIFSAYKTRVLTDSGVVENNTCAITFLNTIL